MLSVQPILPVSSSIHGTNSSLVCFLQSAFVEEKQTTINDPSTVAVDLNVASINNVSVFVSSKKFLLLFSFFCFLTDDFPNLFDLRDV